MPFSEKLKVKFIRNVLEYGEQSTHTVAAGLYIHQFLHLPQHNDYILNK